MKRIPIPKEIHTIFDKPFRIADYDWVPKDENEQPKFIDKASVVQLLTLMVYAIPRDKLTNKDSIEAGRFMDQLRHLKDGVLVLEEAEHDWIKKIVETHGPSVFGVNSNVLFEFLDSFERAHEKRGEETKAE